MCSGSDANHIPGAATQVAPRFSNVGTFLFTLLIRYAGFPL